MISHTISDRSHDDRMSLDIASSIRRTLTSKLALLLLLLLLPHSFDRLIDTMPYAMLCHLNKGVLLRI